MTPLVTKLQSIVGNRLRATKQRLSEPLSPPAEEETRTLRPENIVWMFGSGRTGSTWLMKLIGSRRGYAQWSEPYVGELFGGFYNAARKDQLPTGNFIMGEPYRESWLKAIREFVLEGARVRFPDLTPQDYLVIKESTASRGAPLLVDAMPESRVVWLVRDPRDVIASTMDALGSGSWAHEIIGDSKEAAVAQVVDQQPDLFVRSAAETLMRDTSGAKQAFEAHRGPKTLVRYEELRAEPLAITRRVHSALGLPAEDEQLARVVDRHSWDNIPAEQKGRGKFFRKATPGGWKDDLTAEQVEVVESITAPIFRDLYF